MLSVLLTLMVGVAAAPAPPGPFDPPIAFVKPEVAAARVAACGFESVQPRFDHELQETVIEVRNVRAASVEQLRCTAVASLDTHYYVIFPAPVYQTYETLYERISRERNKMESRAWLDKRGLLSRLPTYDPKRSDDTVFVHALESLCGPKAAGTLRPMHGMATFKEGALGNFQNGTFTHGKLDEETMWCLVNAADASGYSLVFIGNQYHQR